MIGAALAGNDSEVQQRAKELASASAARGDRKQARELNAKALKLMRNGRYDDALPLLESAHRADPGDPEIRENLGYALLKADRVDEAESALLAALEIGPRRASAWGSLGLVYAKRGRHAEAVKLMETAYRSAPDRKKVLESYRRQAKTESDPKVRAMLADVVAHLEKSQ
jgi:Flp pilus assembly protein TadD